LKLCPESVMASNPKLQTLKANTTHSITKQPTNHHQNIQNTASLTQVRFLKSHESTNNQKSLSNSHLHLDPKQQPPPKHIHNFPSPKTQNNHSFNISVPQIYFEGFPIWADYHRIKASFSKFGSVLKLYVSRCVNKSGSLFGFVTLTSNFSDKVLLESVNDIWFECHQLKANFARHYKKIPRENKAPDRSKPKTTIRVPISERDERSYKEVLSEGKVEQILLPVASGPKDYFEKLFIDIEEEDYAWLKRCLLGKIKKKDPITLLYVLD